MVDWKDAVALYEAELAFIGIRSRANPHKDRVWDEEDYRMFDAFASAAGLIGHDDPSTMMAVVMLGRRNIDKEHIVGTIAILAGNNTSPMDTQGIIDALDGAKVYRGSGWLTGHVLLFTANPMVKWATAVLSPDSEVRFRRIAPTSIQEREG
jgi:hypothetical protein